MTQPTEIQIDKGETETMATTPPLEGEQVRKTERTTMMDVQDITKSLPLGRERIEILKGISFQILSGEFVSIGDSPLRIKDLTNGRLFIILNVIEMDDRPLN